MTSLINEIALIGKKRSLKNLRKEIISLQVWGDYNKLDIWKFLKKHGIKVGKTTVYNYLKNNPATEIEKEQVHKNLSEIIEAI